MDKTPQIEVVDLGDAKEQTKGQVNQPFFEDHPVAHTQREPI